MVSPSNHKMVSLSNQQASAFIFPGQGAQFVGMGKDLYQASLKVKEIFDKADSILGFSLSKLCFEGPQEELTQTINCQPAILTTSFALFELFRETKPFNTIIPKYAAGLSLGEYSALLSAGVLGFEDSLLLVRKRAELMEEEAKINPGKMAAVIGLDRQVLKDIALESKVEIANLNCPGQVVISGNRETVEKAKELACNKGAKRVIDLEVSGAFHCSLMRSAADKFAKLLKDITFKSFRFPVISNVSAKPYSGTQDISDKLIKQIYSPVLWEDEVRFMASQGVKIFYEIGPGTILKGLLRKIDVSLEVKSIGSLNDMMLA